MSMYVYAPAGVPQLRNLFLKLGVEFIGSHEAGIGSNWAKGKRYIKKQVMCSGIAIKRTCVTGNRVFNHDYEEYGTEVYYYHKDYCALIVKIVLDYLTAHIDDPSLPQIFSRSDFATLLIKTYSHRTSQLRWVGVNDYKGQGESADKIYRSLNSLQ